MRCDVVIIGGGQAGLAMSRCLETRGVDHAVLERGSVGERWRTQSWASLRLLTPNWLNTLPGAPTPALIRTASRAPMISQLSLPPLQGG